MLLMLLVSLGMSWYAVMAKRAREQREAVEEIRKQGGAARYDYEVQESGPGDPPVPAWLRSLLGVDFFATVVDVESWNSPFTDSGMEHLKGLTRLQTLILCQWQTKLTDAGLKHLERMTELQKLYLQATQVSDAGLEHLRGLTKLQELSIRYPLVTHKGLGRLKKALPSCHIDALDPPPWATGPVHSKP
jgi:hypothetical protein